MAVPTLKILFDRIGNENTLILGGLLDITSSGFDELSPELQSVAETNRVAYFLVDNIAIHVPAKHVSETILKLVRDSLQSTDPKKRKTGCIVAGTCAEGLSEVFVEALDELLPSIIQCLEDASQPIVRDCAAYCLCQFAEFLKPTITNYSELLIGPMMKAMNDSMPLHFCSSHFFDQFIEYLNPLEVKTFIPEMFAKISEVFLDPKYDNFAKSRAMISLSALILGAEEHIAPYQFQINAILKPLLTATDEKSLLLRGSALDTVSHVLFAVGFDDFEKEMFDLGINSAISNFSFDKVELKENSFVFFTNVAKDEKAKFQPFLEPLMNEVFKVLSKPELVRVNEDDEDEEPQFAVEASTAFINVRCAALSLIAMVASQTKQDYLPYVPQTLAFLSRDEEFGALSSIHEEIRVDALPIFHSLVIVNCSLNNVAKVNAITDRIPGELPSPVLLFWKTVYDNLFTILQEDESKRVAARAFEVLTSIINDYGRTFLEFRLNETYEKILFFLNKLALCQQGQKEGAEDDENEEVNDDEDDEDDEEDGEDDNKDPIMVDLAELLDAFTKSLQDEFKPYFDNIHPILLKYTKPPSLKVQRTCAIGCYCTVIETLSPSLTSKYIKAILPVLKEGMTEPYPLIRRNCAYTLSMVIEHSNDEYISRFPEFLGWLQALIAVASKEEEEGGPAMDEEGDEDEEGNESSGGDVDNALSTVARMIMKAPEKVPLAQVLPLLVRKLPLREDQGEGPIIYLMLTELVKDKNPAVMNGKTLLPRLIEAFGEPYHPDTLAIQETKAICGVALCALWKEKKTKTVIEKYLSSLEEEGEDEQADTIRSFLVV